LIFAGALILVALIAALATGGSLQELARTRFQRLEIIVIGLILQLGVTFLPGEFFEERGYLLILIASVAAAAFMFFNRNLPGMMLAAIGLALNVLAISLNQGMPVSLEAIEIAGAPEFAAEGEHTLLDDSTKLPWLTDVVPIPIAGTVLSVGDLFLAAGLAWLVYGRAKGKGELPVDGIENGAGRADDEVVS
jgi:hypothetical protein